VVNYTLVKTALDESGERTLAREARWLRDLAPVRELQGQVPLVIDEGIDAQGRRYLAMRVAQASGETRLLTAGHERFLARLGRTRFRSTDFEVSRAAERLRHALARLESQVSGKTFAMLREAYHECEASLLYWTGPYVLAQGEFAPWNVRVLGPRIFVCDWGRARAEASPLDDVLNYLLIQPALYLGATARLLQSAMRRAHAFAVAAYPQWRWPPRVVGALTLVYLLGALMHHALRELRLDHSDPVVKSYWKLIEKRSAWMPGND
jgi:hypothetical protein